MKFIQKTKTHFDPLFPSAYDLRKSEIGLDRMIEKEKDRLRRNRLRLIKKDIIQIMKVL